MRVKILKFLGSDLFISTFYSGISTTVRVGTAFLMSKLVAIYLGPSGLGLIGQLTNFITIVIVLAGGMINNGVVKYVSEYKVVAPEKISSLLSTAFKVVLVCGGGTGLILIFFSGIISEKVFFNREYSVIIFIFGFSVIFYGLNTFLLSIVNGLKEYRRFNLINILSSLLSLIISFVLIHFFLIKGALIALVVSQSITIIITLYFIKGEEWFNYKLVFQSFDVSAIIKLSAFISMALISTACVPVSQMYVRKYIIEKFSVHDAGLWEVVNRISSVYLMFVVTSLTTYYLPRLSEIIHQNHLRKEIMKVYKVAMPFVILSSLAIYLFRGVIITTLFTEEFQEAKELFLFQMLGDIFKVASWILAFQMVAKAMSKTFIITELVFSILFILLSVFALLTFGLVGVTYAYALNYLIYLLVMIGLFRKLLFKND